MYNYLYLDTNVFSDIAKNKESWSNLKDYMKEEKLHIAFTEALFMELSKKSMRVETRKMIIDSLYEIPMVMLLEADKITQKELDFFPKKLTNNDIFLYSMKNLKDEMSKYNLENNYFPKMGDELEKTIGNVNIMRKNLEERKKNFPPSKSGKYTKEQASEFSFLIVLQELIKFFGVKELTPDFDETLFKTVWMRSMVIFYKYYIDNREIKKESDFGDLFHTSYFSYCKVVVTEADIANTVNKIKNKNNPLKDTTIYSYKEFKKIIDF